VIRGSVYDPNVVLIARIDFERACKLPAESRHLDGLTGTQPADVYARRGADERMNLARAVIYEDDESKWQIIDDWLSDRSRYLDDLAFGALTDSARCDRKRLHFWTSPVRFDLSNVNQNKQTR